METESLETKREGRADRIGFGRRGQVFELAVFLFLIVPSMVLSLFAVKQGNLSFMLFAPATILRDLALLSLVLFFIWRNGEILERIGWTFRRIRSEAGLGIALFIPLLITTSLIEVALRGSGLSGPSKPLPSFLAAKGMGELLIAFVLVVVVAVAEETIFRGYLLLRFKAIPLRPSLAALASAALFSIGHGYEGSVGLVAVAVMGFVFALIYLWRGSLVAPVVMHFLQDFIGVIVLPLVRKG